MKHYLLTVHCSLDHYAFVPKGHEALRKLPFLRSYWIFSGVSENMVNFGFKEDDFASIQKRFYLHVVPIFGKGISGFHVSFFRRLMVMMVHGLASSLCLKGCVVLYLVYLQARLYEEDEVGDTFLVARLGGLCSCPF
ncbi:hypothetical protein U1Q18_016796 [Sarracenia purpurea var. burkii]